MGLTFFVNLLATYYVPHRMKIIDNYLISSWTVIWIVQNYFLEGRDAPTLEWFDNKRIFNFSVGQCLTQMSSLSCIYVHEEI